MRQRLHGNNDPALPQTLGRQPRGGRSRRGQARCRGVGAGTRGFRIQPARVPPAAGHAGDPTPCPGSRSGSTDFRREPETHIRTGLGICRTSLCGFAERLACLAFSWIAADSTTDSFLVLCREAERGFYRRGRFVSADRFHLVCFAPFSPPNRLLSGGKVSSDYS